MIGVSAGGMQALPIVLAPLPAHFPVPVIVVQHLSADADHGFLIRHLDATTALRVREAEERAKVEIGCAYIAPANYHLLVESDGRFALSIDERVNFSRPSIDVLFESAVDAWGADIVGVILTGASADGVHGLRRIRESGGRTIVQDPATADTAFMPKAAIDAGCADHVLPLSEIGPFLVVLEDLETGKGEGS